jgi:hypothetical protein
MTELSPDDFSRIGIALATQVLPSVVLLSFLVWLDRK